jgi:cysteine desulfurase
MSFSGHKMYAPKGIGGLYCNSHSERMPCLQPIMHGGGQEGGLRPGTVPVHMVVALGEAAEIARTEMIARNQTETEMRNWLWQELQSGIGKVSVNGCMERRLPGNLNICIDDIDAELLMLRLGDIAVSTGSACSGKSSAPSHVLKALGLSDKDSFASVRIGIGKSTTKEQLKIVAKRITQDALSLRTLPSLR